MISSMLRKHAGQILFRSSEHFFLQGDFTSPGTSFPLFFMRSQRAVGRKHARSQQPALTVHFLPRGILLARGIQSPVVFLLTYVRLVTAGLFAS
jgi:hypothetical protein